MPKRESLYHRYPDYRVDLEPHAQRVRVTLDGETIADSRGALRVRETKHDPVLYLPREDVRMERLERTDHTTFCPFKGDASYWSIRAGDRSEDDAVSSYEDPFEQVADLTDYVSFYTDRPALVIESLD